MRSSSNLDDAAGPRSTTLFAGLVIQPLEHDWKRPRPSLDYAWSAELRPQVTARRAYHGYAVA